MDGSVALVSGGGRGIGFSFVEILVKNGVYVSLLDINIEFGKKAIKQLENDFNAYGRVLFIKCDVTNNDEFEDAFKKTVDTFGKINIVINNAGIMKEYLDLWELTIDLNFKAVVRGTVLGLKYIENKVDINSAVINIASIAGLSNSVLPIYQSTKRAVIEFTKSIGCSYNSEKNGNNIRIMAICPGPTFDGFENNINEKKALEKKIRTLLTSGEENPNPNRILNIQSTEYVKTALFHVMKTGKSGDVWVVENEGTPRLAHFSSQY